MIKTESEKKKSIYLKYADQKIYVSKSLLFVDAGVRLE